MGCQSCFGWESRSERGPPLASLHFIRRLEYRVLRLTTCHKTLYFLKILSTLLDRQPLFPQLALQRRNLSKVNEEVRDADLPDGLYRQQVSQRFHRHHAFGEFFAAVGNAAEIGLKFPPDLFDVLHK